MKRKISPLYLMSIFIAVNRLLSFKVILLFSSCDKSILLLKINPVDDKLLSTSCAIHLFFHSLDSSIPPIPPKWEVCDRTVIIVVEDGKIDSSFCAKLFESDDFQIRKNALGWRRDQVVKFAPRLQGRWPTARSFIGQIVTSSSPSYSSWSPKSKI